MIPDGRRFPYLTSGNSTVDSALRSQLPLTLIYGDQSLDTYGLLDTGADVNVLPYSIGRALGAIWSDQVTSVVLSGNLARYEARGIIVAAKVGQFDPVRLAFAWTQTDNVPLLLGQINFFMEFDACFFRSEASFEVRPRRRLAP